MQNFIMVCACSRTLLLYPGWLADGTSSHQSVRHESDTQSITTTSYGTKGSSLPSTPLPHSHFPFSPPHKRHARVIVQDIEPRVIVEDVSRQRLDLREGRKVPEVRPHDAPAARRHASDAGDGLVDARSRTSVHDDAVPVGGERARRVQADAVRAAGDERYSPPLVRR